MNEIEVGANQTATRMVVTEVVSNVVVEDLAGEHLRELAAAPFAGK